MGLDFIVVPYGCFNDLRMAIIFNLYLADNRYIFHQIFKIRNIQYLWWFYTYADGSKTIAKIYPI
jgi:hypothetical protein